ncbi:MAG: MOSC domain-containing protein [Pseudomonadota bacterium]
MAVCQDAEHRFSKGPVEEIEIIAGFGVRGDAHAGERVKHLSRVRANPDQPNLRQVHLIQCELFEELAAGGFSIKPGDLGENITTTGLDLLTLGKDTLLRIGPSVVLSVTGLRNPCHQIDTFAPGLLAKVALKTKNGIVRKAGIMAIVLEGGTVRPSDTISAEPPDGSFIPLDRV